MSNFVKLWVIEFRLLLNPRRLGLIVLIFLFAMLVVIGSTIDVEQQLQSGKKFQEWDEAKFKELGNYVHYSLYGVRYQIIPHPFSSFLSISKISDNLAGRVDSVVSLDISLNKKGDDIFNQSKSSTFRISFIFLLLGTFCSMFLGTGIFDAVAKYRYLLPDIQRKKIFIFLVIARAFFIIFVFLLLFAASLFILFIRGIGFQWYILFNFSGYLLASFIMLIVSQTVGVLIGLNRQKTSIVTLVLIVSFICVFIIPDLMNEFNPISANTHRSRYELELAQLTIVNQFDKEAVKITGKFGPDTMHLYKKQADKYYDGDFLEVEKLETDFIDNLEGKIKIFNKISLITPFTFFKITADEISASGYWNYLDFHNFLKVEKRKFLRFFFDKEYSKDRDVMAPFKTQHVYYGKSRLPALFWVGVLINLGYLVLLLFWALWRFDNRFYRLSEKKIDTRGVNIDLQQGKINIVGYSEKDIFRRILGAFHGKTRHFKGRITIGGEALTRKHRRDTIWLIHTGDMPDAVTVEDFLRYYARRYRIGGEAFGKLLDTVGKEQLSQTIETLDGAARFDILAAIATVSPHMIVLVEDFPVGMSNVYKKRFSRILNGLTEQGKTVVYCCSEPTNYTVSSALYLPQLDGGRYKTGSMVEN